MRNQAILSVDVEDVEVTRSIIDQLGSLFGGVLIPSWRIYSSLLELIQGKRAAIWLNLGAGFSSQIQTEVSSIMHYFFPDSLMSDETPIPPEGIISLCYPHLIQQIQRAFLEGVREYKARNLRHQVPPDWQPPIFPTTALTTEERDDRVLNRAKIAKDNNLPGVVVPCEWVGQAKAMGLKTIITAIRDPKYPVLDDDQIIVCSPFEAKEANPDYFIVGRPITNRYAQEKNIEEAKKAAGYFVSELL